MREGVVLPEFYVQGLANPGWGLHHLLKVFWRVICPFRADRRRRKARRKKCTYENCTLPTIHLGPAGRRPALGLVCQIFCDVYGGCVVCTCPPSMLITDFLFNIWNMTGKIITSEIQIVRLLDRHYGLELDLMRGPALRGQGSLPIGQTPPILLVAGHVTLTKTKMGREVSYFERWNV